MNFIPHNTHTAETSWLQRIHYGVLLFTATVLSAQGANAAGKLFGAHFQKPVLTLTASTNGMMTVSCKVGLLGGCCFPLTSHGVTAALEVPPTCTIVQGPTPAEYPSIEAPPSGTPQAWAIFDWQIRATTPEATGELRVTVSSPDSGKVEALYSLSKTTSITLRGPQLPDVLSPGEEISLVVDAASLREDRYLKSVRFWYSAEIPPQATNIEIPEGLEQHGILRFTEQGHERMVQGQPLDLRRKYEPTRWYGSLTTPTNSMLCGVAVATDDVGHCACSPAVRSAAPSAQRAPARVENVFSPSVWFLFVCTLVIVLRAARVRSAKLLVAAVPFALLCVALILMRTTPAGPVENVRDYPVDGSVTACLFLNADEPSRQLAEQFERYRSAAPHRIHLLCFVEGVTPDPIFKAYRDILHVKQIPSVVFDATHCIDGTNTVALTGTLDRCFNKVASRLSMELHGGIIAKRELSIGFIMCNHVRATEVRGYIAAFAYESNVSVGTWRCQRVVRHLLEEKSAYAIPAKLCKPPLLLKWKLPEGVQPDQTGALILILDESGQVIDSICTEKPCLRTGICG